MDDIFGGKPNIQPICTASSSGMGNSQLVPVTPTKRTEEKKRKREYKPKATENVNTIINWLERYEERKRAREAEVLERMERLEREKLELFKEYISKL